MEHHSDFDLTSPTAETAETAEATETTETDPATATLPEELMTASGTPVPQGWLKTVATVFSGQVFSILSSAAAGYALIWYLTMTGSAAVLILGTIFYMLPMALLSPFVGAFVDRFNRKHIMILADIFIALVTLVMILMIVVGFVNISIVLIMIAIRSAGQCFHMTAMNAVLPLLVPERHLVRAGSVTSGLGAASNIVGPAIGIALFEAFGLHIALSIDIVGALIACSVLFFVKIPDIHLAKAEQTKLLREMKDGLSEIRQTRGMTPYFVLVSTAIVFFMPMAALFPLMTVQHFGGGGYQAAMIEAAWGFTFLIGTVMLGIWGGGKRLIRLIMASLAAVATITLVCGLLPSSGYWWFFALTGLMGLIGVFFDTPLIAVVQKNIAPERLGRVLSVFNSLTAGASLLGLGLVGAIGDFTGVALIFVASGIGMLLVFGVSLFTPSIHKLDRRS
jgi:DHA3 family macrolide efflux protein-like MFS transporter